MKRGILLIFGIFFVLMLIQGVMAPTAPATTPASTPTPVKCTGEASLDIKRTFILEGDIVDMTNDANKKRTIDAINKLIEKVFAQIPLINQFYKCEYPSGWVCDEHLCDVNFFLYYLLRIYPLGSSGTGPGCGEKISGNDKISLHFSYYQLVTQIGFPPAKPPPEASDAERAQYAQAMNDWMDKAIAAAMDQALEKIAEVAQNLKEMYKCPEGCEQSFSFAIDEENIEQSIDVTGVTVTIPYMWEIECIKIEGETEDLVATATLRLTKRCVDKK